jgi:hypothetical protein
MTTMPLSSATVPLVAGALLMATTASAALADPARDLALGYCLHAEGIATQQQSYQFVASRARRQGWPQDWYRAIAPQQIQAVIANAGGCGRLLRPEASPASRSAGEGFGLAPYR